MIYLCNRESYFRSSLCIFMGLKFIGKVCPSVLMMQTQKTRIVLFIFNLEPQVCALALHKGLVLEFCSTLPRGAARERTPTTDVGIRHPGLVLSPPTTGTHLFSWNPLLLLRASLPPSSTGLHTQTQAPKRQPHGSAARLPGSTLARQAWWEERQAGSGSSCVTLGTFPHRARFLVY